MPLTCQYKPPHRPFHNTIEDLIGKPEETCHTVHTVTKTTVTPQVSQYQAWQAVSWSRVDVRGLHLMVQLLAALLLRTLLLKPLCWG